MELSTRLNTIASILKYRTLVDIGTDHCFLPIFVIKNNIIDKALATEISRLPLAKAKENLIKYNVTNVELQKSDGFEAIETNFESCVISGMGGRLISEIITKNLQKVQKFKQIILSPQNSVEYMRKFLISHNFSIEDEFMLVENGRFYNIIECFPKNTTLNDEDYTKLEYIFGRKLIEKKCPIMLEYAKAELNKTYKIIQKLPSYSTRYIDLTLYASLCNQVLREHAI